MAPISRGKPSRQGGRRNTTVRKKGKPFGTATCKRNDIFSNARVDQIDTGLSEPSEDLEENNGNDPDIYDSESEYENLPLSGAHAHMSLLQSLNADMTRGPPMRKKRRLSIDDLNIGGPRSSEAEVSSRTDLELIQKDHEKLYRSEASSSDGEANDAESAADAEDQEQSTLGTRNLIPQIV